jgi:uncharacterized protein
MGGFEMESGKGGCEPGEAQGRFCGCRLSLEDPRALTIADPDAIGEDRFITLAADPTGRILITVYSYSGTNRRIISARKASSGERKRYEAR